MQVPIRIIQGINVLVAVTFIIVALITWERLHKYAIKGYLEGSLFGERLSFAFQLGVFAGGILVSGVFFLVIAIISFFVYKKNKRLPCEN